MERSAIRDSARSAKSALDFASLHPGYLLYHARLDDESSMLFKIIAFIAAAIPLILFHAVAGAALLVVVTATDNARSQPATPVAECESLMRAADVHRRTIEAARRVLSADEASCALAAVSMDAIGGACARIKEAVNADAEKRRAWADAITAWGYLDRLLLSVRSLEDRLGVTCPSR